MNKPTNRDINVGALYVPTKGTEKLLALEYSNTRKGQGNETKPLPIFISFVFYDTDRLRQGVEQGILRWGYRYEEGKGVVSGNDSNAFSAIPGKEQDSLAIFSNAYLGCVTFTSQ